MAREHHSHQDAVITTGEHGLPLTSPSWRAAWSIVIALGLTTIVSYGTIQYLFGVLEVPLATTFAWSRAELSGAYCFSRASSACRSALSSIALEDVS
jgi:hypothetical protein